jgi:hypothetical protein
VSGRTSGGVRGIRLGPADEVVSLQVVIPDGALVMVSGNGLGKKTRFVEFPRQGRGGMGVRAAVVNRKTGPFVAGRAIGPDTEEVVAISANGVVIRVPVRGIKFSHRQAQGATLMKVQPGDTVVALAILGPESADGEPSSNGAAAEALVDAPIDALPAPNGHAGGPDGDLAEDLNGEDTDTEGEDEEEDAELEGNDQA